MILLTIYICGCIATIGIMLLTEDKTEILKRPDYMVMAVIIILLSWVGFISEILAYKEI